MHPSLDPRQLEAWECNHCGSTNPGQRSDWLWQCLMMLVCNDGWHEMMLFECRGTTYLEFVAWDIAPQHFFVCCNLEGQNKDAFVEYPQGYWLLVIGEKLYCITSTSNHYGQNISLRLQWFQTSRYIKYWTFSLIFVENNDTLQFCFYWYYDTHMSY